MPSFLLSQALVDFHKWKWQAPCSSMSRSMQYCLRLFPRKSVRFPQILQHFTFTGQDRRAEIHYFIMGERGDHGRNQLLGKNKLHSSLFSSCLSMHDCPGSPLEMVYWLLGGGWFSEPPEQPMWSWTQWSWRVLCLFLHSLNSSLTSSVLPGRQNVDM